MRTPTDTALRVRKRRMMAALLIAGGFISAVAMRKATGEPAWPVLIAGITFMLVVAAMLGAGEKSRV